MLLIHVCNVRAALYTGTIKLTRCSFMFRPPFIYFLGVYIVLGARTIPIISTMPSLHTCMKTNDHVGGVCGIYRSFSCHKRIVMTTYDMTEGAKTTRPAVAATRRLRLRLTSNAQINRAYTMRIKQNPTTNKQR